MQVAVFCAASRPHNSSFISAATALGRGIAKGGHTLLYGGSNLGLMGAVSTAALQEGGRVVGVIPTLFSEKIIHSQHVSELIRVGSMADRKEYLITHSDIFIALPGGIGTLDEVLEVMVANQIGSLRGRVTEDSLRRGKPILLLNQGGFFNPFLAQLDQMRATGLFQGNANLQVVSDVTEAINFLSNWRFTEG